MTNQQGVTRWWYTLSNLKLAIEISPSIAKKFGFLTTSLKTVSHQVVGNVRPWNRTFHVSLFILFVSCQFGNSQKYLHKPHCRRISTLVLYESDLWSFSVKLFIWCVLVEGKPFLYYYSLYVAGNFYVGLLWLPWWLTRVRPAGNRMKQLNHEDTDKALDQRWIFQEPL